MGGKDRVFVCGGDLKVAGRLVTLEWKSAKSAPFEKMGLAAFGQNMKVLKSSAEND